MIRYGTPRTARGYLIAGIVFAFFGILMLALIPLMLVLSGFMGLYYSIILGIMGGGFLTFGIIFIVFRHQYERRWERKKYRY